MIRYLNRPSGPWVLGVDPGFDGGIAALGLDGTTLAAGPMPSLKVGSGRRDIDGCAFNMFFMDIHVDIIIGRIPHLRPRLVVVEKVGSMPGQGIAGAFSFGKGYGKILGVLEARGVPHQLVTPQAWKKAILSGTDKSKAAAIAYCRKRFPSVDLRPTDKCKVPSDGIAESLCLAEFARRLVAGEERVA